MFQMVRLCVVLEAQQAGIDSNCLLFIILSLAFNTYSVRTL